MTDQVAVAPRGPAPGRTRRRILAAGAVVAVVVAAGLWIIGRLPGAPMREGPLEGNTAEVIRVPTETIHTGLLWGTLVLHNGTSKDIVLEQITLADKPQKLIPSAGPYIWDEGRVALINGGAISAYTLPLPSKFTIPPRHRVEGFTIAPQAEDGSVEVVYEFPLPDTAVTVKGITVRYRTAGIVYRKTYDVTLTICAPSDPKPCNLL